MNAGIKEEVFGGIERGVCYLEHRVLNLVLGAIAGTRKEEEAALERSRNRDGGFKILADTLHEDIITRQVEQNHRK